VIAVIYLFHNVWHLFCSFSVMSKGDVVITVSRNIAKLSVMWSWCVAWTYLVGWLWVNWHRRGVRIHWGLSGSRTYPYVLRVILRYIYSLLYNIFRHSFSSYTVQGAPTLEIVIVINNISCTKRFRQLYADKYIRSLTRSMMSMFAPFSIRSFTTFGWSKYPAIIIDVVPNWKQN
jgi:hypothetical protein